MQARRWILAAAAALCASGVVAQTVLDSPELYAGEKTLYEAAKKEGMVVSFDTDPKLCEMLLGEVQKGIERLAAEAPSEQEVNEAMLYFRKVNAESRSKNLKSTSYWLNKMRAEYFDGVDLDKDNEALFTAVTPAEVRRLAREILAQGNRYTAVFTQE